MHASKLFTQQAARLPLRTFTTSRQPTSFFIFRPALRSSSSTICTACRPRIILNPTTPRAFLRQWPGRVRFNSSKPSPSPNPTPHLGSPEPAPSLSQRLRKLSREYGWSALGVYLTFSALDFPFCFLAVRMLGTDRIGRWEHAVIEAFWNVVHIPFPHLGSNRQDAESGVVLQEGETTREGAAQWGSGVAQAEADNSGTNASIWTQLALAYAIHKSFIFIRVPLTAAVTPKVVKTLRGWGWDIGKRKPKPKSN